MTKKYLVTFNPTPMNQKPKKNSREMNFHLKGIRTLTGLTINEFAAMVAVPNSHTWYGGTYTNCLCNQNWTSTQVIGLDFDKGDYSITQTIEKLQSNGINPQLWYSSFSSTADKPKFRVVLFIDQPITNPTHRELIYKGLLELVPHADHSCKNAARIFFGGQQAVVLHDEPIQLQTLINSTAIAVVTGDKGRSRHIPKELLSQINGENGEFLSSTNRNYPFLPKIITTPTSLNGETLLSIDWEKGKERVRILREFMDGEWLYHDQLFGLATNLMYIKGGQRLMKDTMLKFNAESKTNYSENNFNILTYLKRVAYPPIPIHRFSPYDEDADLYDLYGSVVESRGKIEIVHPVSSIPLQEAEKKFKAYFHEVLENKDDKGIYLFKVPTAIGKTELLTQINATLAFPIHALKNEVKERMQITNVISPETINFVNENLNLRLHYLYGAGMLQKATALIHEVAKSEGNSEYSMEDIIRAKHYLTQLKKSQDSPHAVLTTHARALHLEHQHSTIIFDEDPLDTILPIQMAQLSDLIKVQLISGNLYKQLQEYINHFTAAQSGICYPSPTFHGEPEELIEVINKVRPESNLIGLLRSSYFIKDARDQNTVHYIQVNAIPHNKKIIILSATAPVPIYKALLKERLTVFELTDVEQKGKIIQYTKQSCSRNSLGRYVSSIAEKVGDNPVITFKRFQENFQNPVKGMYFGNCSGYDSLKGKDIAVVGTPHRNNVVYHLLGSVLGNSTATSTMTYQKIVYNGFRFKFNCYENELLRNIQLSLIESDLVQAVGRARTLRSDAIVHLYSNFPLRLSSNFIF